MLPGKPTVFVMDIHKGTALLWSNSPRNSEQLAKEVSTSYKQVPSKDFVIDDQLV